VAVISYTYWNRRFGGDASVIGTRIDLNGAPFTIVGGARAGFSGTEPAASNPTAPGGADGRLGRLRLNFWCDGLLTRNPAGLRAGIGRGTISLAKPPAMLFTCLTLPA
jgi:hypothetical protein